MFYKETTTPSSIIMSEFPLNSPNNAFNVMTPNTVKSIEQSILASLEVQTSNPQIIASQATGNFVPPLPSTHTTTQQSQPPQLILAHNWHGGATIQKYAPSSEEEEEEDDLTTTEEDKKPVKKAVVGQRRQVKRGGGGRKRAGGGGEEDERRLIRRERNKLAAARCRKRRVDHTNLLVEETESLESKRSHLQSSIQLYQQKKEEFEFLLQAHLPICSFSTEDKKYVPPTTTTTPTTIATTPTTKEKPKRPTSLQVNNTSPISLPTNSTPSNGLNFDNIDWGLSGLTPGMTPVGVVSLTTPLATPNTVREILSGLGNNKFVSL